MRLAAALSVRQGDMFGEVTRGLLRATLRSSPSPAALVVLAELEMNTNDIVDQAVRSYLRWANSAMWDSDAEIAWIIEARFPTGAEEDDVQVIE